MLCATTLTLLALIIGGSLLPAQKVLQIEKYGKPQAEKMYIGDPITFQLRNEYVSQQLYRGYPGAEDSLLVLSDRYVNVHNITVQSVLNAPGPGKPVDSILVRHRLVGVAAIGTALDK